MIIGSWDSTRDPLLTPGEVAEIFRVHPKTVTRWAESKQLACIRTLGDHRRYRSSHVEMLLEGKKPPRDFFG